MSSLLGRISVSLSSVLTETNRVLHQAKLRARICDGEYDAF